MTRTADLLAAFGEQVRKNTAPDGTGAVYEADGRVLRRLAEPGLDGSGIVWSDLSAVNVDEVIAAQVELFAARGQRFEWKLYSYDEPADLAERLRGAGFVAGEPESLMIAEVNDVLARLGDAGGPAGVWLAEVTHEAGVDQLVWVHEQVFGKDGSARRAELLAQLIAAPERVGLVVAFAGASTAEGSGPSRARGCPPVSGVSPRASTAGGSGPSGARGCPPVSGVPPRASTAEPVAAARIEFVTGARFAGLWGGGTLAPWRGRGIYRALVRHRAELAAARGYRYLTVDASDQSRPILERVGFERVAITTPYLWSPENWDAAGHPRRPA